MRNKKATEEFYVNRLAFSVTGDYDNYMILRKDSVEIHFFMHASLDPRENYGQVYIRTTGISNYYQELLDRKVRIHPNGFLEMKPWGQKEFSLLDPDSNLLTFGEAS